MRRTLLAITLFLTLAGGFASAEDPWNPRIPDETTSSWYSSFDWVWEKLLALV